MFYILQHHGLRVEFSRALSNAMFIDNKDDKAHIQAWVVTQTPKTSFEELLCTSPSWVCRHCKPVISPPNILHPLISKVFHTYGPLKDSVTGTPSFTSENWKTAKNILDLVFCGYLSDSSYVPLYTVLGVDAKTGLNIYHCAHGTNFTEEGVHTHLQPHLPTGGTSVQHDDLINPVEVTGCVNGNLYSQTKETIGVILIPETIHVEYGMAEFQPSVLGPK
ncbi:hypothetical protein BJ165DRAFT_1529921 [Panaeolus papilionaceus]|nr:hypothetical protein BJ165DRAFT_1529921 [Panaeolus papilionaceus]